MGKKIFNWFYTAAVFVFLYAPIAVLMAMSFNESQYNALPFKFSMRWFEALAQNEKLIDATMNSLYLAAITGVVCIILATALMLGNQEASAKIKALVNSAVVLPLTIPWLIMGLSLLLLLKSLGLDRNFLMLLIGHVIISLPYAVLVISARMQDMDKSVQEASYSLGANEWTTFIRVIFPMISPAMLAGGFMAFMVSFDNFVLSYFLIPTGTTTLPIEIYSSIKFGFTPEINAISTIILVLSLLVISIIAAIMGSSLKNFFR